MTPADLQRLYEYMLDIVGFMRSVRRCAVIEDPWVELVHMLPPREPQHAGKIRPYGLDLFIAPTQHEIGGYQGRLRSLVRL